MHCALAVANLRPTIYAPDVVKSYYVQFNADHVRWVADISVRRS